MPGAYDREREAARARLARATVAAGFPEEFGLALAEFLGGPATMDRMSEYLLAVRPRSMEEAADEAVALVEQRARWVDQARSAEASDAYTRWLNRPDRPLEDDDGQTAIPVE